MLLCASRCYTLPISPGWLSMITNTCVCTWVCKTVAAPSEEQQGEASWWKSILARHVVPLLSKYYIIADLHPVRYNYTLITDNTHFCFKKHLMNLCMFAGDWTFWGSCLDTFEQHSQHLRFPPWKPPPPSPSSTLLCFLILSSSCTVYFSSDDAGKIVDNIIQCYFCSALATEKKMTHLFFFW